MSSIRKISVATAGSALLLWVVNLSISSAASAFTVSQESNNNNFLTSLLGSNSGLSDFNITTKGDAAAFGTFNGATAPFGIDQGVVLSTGKVVEIPGQNTKDGSTTASDYDLSTNFNRPGSSTDTHDLAQMDISFKADSTADKLFFQYVFGSEEFKEYGGSAFNDSFKLLLNGVNLAKLTDGKLVTVNNLVSKPGGPFSIDYIDNPAGSNTLTKLDGFTKVLTFEGALNKNATNTLSIQVEDVGDGTRDSAVLIKGGSVGTQAPPVVEPLSPVSPSPTSVPEPSSALGMFTFAALNLAWMLKRQVKKQSLQLKSDI